MKVFLKYVFIFCLSVLISLAVFGAENDTNKKDNSKGSVTIDNDGKKRDKKDCYGDSKLPSSYDIEYYDCYLPYTLTPKDIGGYSIKLEDGRNVKWYSYVTYDYCMESYYKNRITEKFTHHINGYKPDASVSGLTISKDPATGACLYTDSNGNEFYGTAIQNWFYDTKKAKIGWNNQNGQLVDAILTNGTVIHFVVTDANAIGHTNGGPEADFDVGYRFADMKLNQYKNIFHAAFGNCIELTPYGSYGAGCDAFEKKFFPKGVEIAYYRMYNVKASSQKKRANGVPKDASYSLGDVNITSSAQSGEGQTEAKVSLEKKAIKDEWELHGMPEKSHLADDQQYVELPNGFENSQDSINADGIKENINSRTENTIGYWSRVIVASLGLFLLIYIILLVACWLFDRSNIVLDFSLVEMLTLGLVKPTREEVKEGVLLSTRRLVRICVIIFCAAALLISGGVFDVLQRLLNWVTSLF